MTETVTKPQTSITELAASVRESQRHERALAREVDELPDLIRAATHADAIRKADAARQGKDSLAETEEARREWNAIKLKQLKKMGDEAKAKLRAEMRAELKDELRAEIMAE